VPKRSLLDELRKNDLIRARLPRADDIILDLEMKVREFRSAPSTASGLASVLDDDELGSILAYTHDLLMDQRAGNLYWELNLDLKLRDAELRVDMMQRWGAQMHYMMRGLKKIPSYQGTAFRGIDTCEAAAEYTTGRPIQWGSWTSVSADDGLPKKLAGRTGVVFKISLFSGKRLDEISFFPQEGEIVLSPDSRFIVTRSAYSEDGFTFVDLLEQQGSAYRF